MPSLTNTDGAGIDAPAFKTALSITPSDITGLGTAATEDAIYINVREAPYNAVGNGVADDRAAIQAAIDATLVAGASKIVFLPAGTYKITTPLTLKGTGLSIVGVGAYRTLITPAVNQHGFNVSNAVETRHMRISGLGIIGPGADITTGSGIYARFDNGAPIGSQLVVEDFQINGFANGIWAQEMPRLALRDGLLANNAVGARLAKADTFIFHNIGMGAADVAAETWGYIIGTETLGNFAGEIVLGEYGDLDHFMLVNRGRVAVADVNIERVGAPGGYVTQIDSGLAQLTWSRGRISPNLLLGGDANTGALWRILAPTSDKGGTLTFLANPQIGAPGWRHVEAVGSFAYQAIVTGVTAEGHDNINLTHCSTAGGTASVSSAVTSQLTASGSAWIYADAAKRGQSFFQAIEGAGAPDRDVRAVKTQTGAYATADRLNRNLIDVLYDTTASATNTSTTETTLMAYALPANYFHETEQTIRITAFGKFAANANNKKITVTVGGSFGGTATIYDSTALAINGNDWSLDVLVARTTTGSTFHSRVIAGCDDPLFTKKLAVTKGLAGHANQVTTFAIKATGGATSDIELIYGQVHFMRNDSTL